MKRKNLEPVPIGEVLPAVLKGARGTSPGLLERVRAAWRAAVGDVAAARSRPFALAEGVLQVRIASASLKHDLATFRRTQILDALRSQLPGVKIREVRYRVGAVPRS